MKKILMFALIFFCNINLVAGIEGLSEKIDAIISEHPNLHTAVEVYSIKNKQTLYSHNSNKLFIPASNAKLFTVLAALELLGADYQFQTQFLTDGDIVDSQLHGNLYFKAVGDSTLKSEDIENLIEHLSESIHKINGNFCIDLQEFDSEFFGPGAMLEDLGKNYNVPVSAFIVDHKAADIDHSDINFIDYEKLKSCCFDVAAFIVNLLEKYHIELCGKILFNPTDENCKVICGHKSEKLSMLIMRLLKESDNLDADCLFKKIGALQYQKPGTWKKGFLAIKDFLKNKLNIKPDETRIVDGSGLSRYTLISAHQIVSLLVYAHQQKYFSQFYSSLPESGTSGTLKNRMKDIPNVIHAKTGTMSGISALSGYVEITDDLLVFSILNNGYIGSASCAHPCKSEIEDEICRVLAAA